MAPSPSVRVASARDVLEFADKYAPGAREAILATFPPEALRAFHDSSRLAWLPIEQHHWMVDGMVRHFGRERAIHCWRAAVPEVVDKPLLRNFVWAMLRLVGRTPPRVIDLSVQLHGGEGVRAGHIVERLYREIRALRIYEGASDVQRVIIARAVLAGDGAARGQT